MGNLGEQEEAGKASKSDILEPLNSWETTTNQSFGGQRSLNKGAKQGTTAVVDVQRTQQQGQTKTEAKRGPNLLLFSCCEAAEQPNLFSAGSVRHEDKHRRFQMESGISQGFTR